MDHIGNVDECNHGRAISLEYIEVSHDGSFNWKIIYCWKWSDETLDIDRTVKGNKCDFRCFYVSLSIVHHISKGSGI